MSCGRIIASPQCRTNIFGTDQAMLSSPFKMSGHIAEDLLLQDSSQRASKEVTHVSPPFQQVRRGKQKDVFIVSEASGTRFDSNSNDSHSTQASCATDQWCARIESRKYRINIRDNSGRSHTGWLKFLLCGVVVWGHSFAISSHTRSSTSFSVSSCSFELVVNASEIRLTWYDWSCCSFVSGW